jgi:hypothetical protein
MDKMIVIIDQVAELVRQWLNEDPTRTIAAGTAGLAVIDVITGGKISQAGLKVYDFLKDFLIQAYNITERFVGLLMGYVRFLLNTFEIDNPRRTFMLSLIFFFLVLGIVLIFSGQSWANGGITDMEPKNFDIADFSGVAAIGGSGGNVLPPPNESITTTTNQQPIPNNYTWVNVCSRDEDCDRVYGEGGFRSGFKCCYPSTYAGYACQGQCLKDETITDRDACKHPSMCNNANVDAKQRARVDATNCLDKNPTPNDYCRQLGDNNARCCDDNDDTVCYGYCTRNGSTHDCHDYTQCYFEFEEGLGYFA